MCGFNFIELAKSRTFSMTRSSGYWWKCGVKSWKFSESHLTFKGGCLRILKGWSVSEQSVYWKRKVSSIYKSVCGFFWVTKDNFTKIYCNVYIGTRSMVMVTFIADLGRQNSKMFVLESLCVCHTSEALVCYNFFHPKLWQLRYYKFRH